LATAQASSGGRIRRPLRDLGAMRTMMAADRTLMAWIRTSLSLLSFGFAIYKILQDLEESGKLLPHDNAPRNLGLFLGMMGTLAIIMGSISYWHTFQELHQDDAYVLLRPAFIMAVLMCVTGLLLVFGILAKIL
jgi:putative membrane protein